MLVHIAFWLIDSILKAMYNQVKLFKQGALTPSMASDIPGTPSGASDSNWEHVRQNQADNFIIHTPGAASVPASPLWSEEQKQQLQHEQKMQELHNNKKLQELQQQQQQHEQEQQLQQQILQQIESSKQQQQVMQHEKKQYEQYTMLRQQQQQSQMKPIDMLINTHYQHVMPKEQESKRCRSSSNSLSA